MADISPLIQVKIAKILMIPEKPIERINFEPLNSQEAKNSSCHF